MLVEVQDDGLFRKKSKEKWIRALGINHTTLATRNCIKHKTPKMGALRKFKMTRS
jgi:hypothetical protein